MNVIEQEIIEKIHALPSEEQQQVLRFVQTLEIRKRKRLNIFEEIDRITNEVSLEDWAELPTDGAERVDSYLYGAGKEKK